MAETRCHRKAIEPILPRSWNIHQVYRYLWKYARAISAKEAAQTCKCHRFSIPKPFQLLQDFNSTNEKQPDWDQNHCFDDIALYLFIIAFSAWYSFILFILFIFCVFWSHVKALARIRFRSTLFTSIKFHFHFVLDFCFEGISKFDQNSLTLLG